MGATLLLCGVLTSCSGDNMNITQLMRQDAKVGTGAEAVPGRQVQVHYTGWLYDEGRPRSQGKQVRQLAR
jgi:FKBP-type peptidyl-prolyl cis-trans isomerase FkpA